MLNICALYTLNTHQRGEGIGVFWCLIWLTQILERAWLKMQGGGGGKGGVLGEGVWRGGYLGVMHVWVNKMMSGWKGGGCGPLWCTDSFFPNESIWKSAGGWWVKDGQTSVKVRVSERTEGVRQTETPTNKEIIQLHKVWRGFQQD